MEEYIERDRLKCRLDGSPLFANFGSAGFFIRKAVFDLIAQQPAEDVVKVVRCKNCQSWAGGDCWRQELTGPDDFCSYGKEMEKEEVKE